MNKIDEIIKQEIDELIENGQQILRKAMSSGDDMKGDDLTNVSTWVTRLGQLIRRLYGVKSQQFVSYSLALGTRSFYTIHSNCNAHISILLGVTNSIKHDFEHGFLIDLRSLIQADIFADFLGMSEYLLREGYKDAAAVIIGAVLEDSLRKLAIANSLPIENEKGKPLTIDPLNVSLAKADVYNKLVQKQITTWAHLRNNAAHGQYDEYDKSQVEMMLLFVQKFASEQLA